MSIHAKVNRWPVLRSYEGRGLARVALPLGGIGTGTVSLGGRGDLRDWEIVNRPAKRFVPPHSFFALRAQAASSEPVARLLEGALLPPYEGWQGAAIPNAGLPRFRNCRFLAAYPFGQVELSDPDVPVHARIEAFNPFIPADPDRSGLPVAAFRIVLENRTDRPVAVTIAGSLQNFIGTDGTNGTSRGNVNVVRGEPGLTGLFLQSAGVPPDAEQWGTIALATTATENVTWRTSWADLDWGGDLLDFWEDLLLDGRLDDRAPGSTEAPIASLAVARELPPGRTDEITFLFCWHFPNRLAWPGGPRIGGDARVGNFYTTRFADAWDVARYVSDDLAALEEDALRFVRAFCMSDLPATVKEAALFNLSTLRTQTCFRAADGRFYGWEGCADTVGSCFGSCTHVWNYEQATPFLFGSLARTMREIEFLHATRDDGHMSCRVHLPLERAAGYGLAAADGQMGCVMKLYRDWRLSGDNEFLRRLWPRARKTLEFCWIPGGWDADRDGVMEGCQHNTMDVEYYGPNPQMGIWYLGALRAAEEMARFLGEPEFATECRGLFERGQRWLDAHLFNGEYYEHQIRAIDDPASIAPGLRHETMGARDPANPSFQLGAGCLVDQLVGQYMAEICGLGYLVEPDHIRQTLRATMRHNFRDELDGHVNNLRAFALHDEAALLMATYPRGDRPARPFPYFNEVMTGFEYTVAAHLFYEGERDDGLRVIEAIRNRYDGERRNPFDEAECGHHYARAMASWAAILALTGFRYDGVDRSISFARADDAATWFWSSGDAWGTVRQEPVDDDEVRIELSVLGGTLSLQCIRVGEHTAQLQPPRTLYRDDHIVVIQHRTRFTSD